MKNQAKTENILAKAVALHQKGDRDGAQKIYEKVIKEDPGSFDANHLLGVVFLQKEIFAKALTYIDYAINIDDKQARAWSNKSLALKGLDRLDDALICVNHAIALDSNFPESFYNKANILAKQGNLTEALSALNSFTEKSPNHHLGFFVKGNLFRELKMSAEAIDAYRRVIALQPNFFPAISNLGLCLAEEGEFDEALECFDEALKLHPHFPECLLNKGVAFEKLGEYQKAIASYDLALNVNPNFIEALQNKGVALEKLGDLEGAIDSYNQAIAINENYATAYFNRGYAHERLQKIDESIADYEKALSLNPEREDINWNRALMLLCKGDFKSGWAAYESRTRLDHAVNFYETERLKPFEWRGPIDSIQNKTILVRSEQGLGDTIQFCRYVELLKSLGAKVILEVQPPLVELLKSLNGLDEVFAKGMPLPPFNYYCNLMSLPLLMGTSLETIPSQIPYLNADPVKVELWRKRLGPKTAKRVGLVWSGGFRPDQPELWPLNKRRNIELIKLKELKTEGVEFYSLQKGELPESELVVLYLKNWDGPSIINYADDLIDFTDTAALIENLDLVISVDTSTAHLAGALGKPVWLMNRFDTCWRWLLNRSDSPWYPTFKIFRQSAPDDWGSVVHEVANELKVFSKT